MLKIISEWKSVLCCPICTGELDQDVSESSLKCLKCRIEYVYRNNLPIMVPRNKKIIGIKESSELDAQMKEHSEIRPYIDESTNEKVHSRIATLLEKHQVATNHDSKILEVGSGPFESLHDVIAGIKIAVDPLASTYQESLPIMRSRSNIIEAMAEILPFRANYFDILVTRNSFDHLNNPEIALLEFHRVLKKDGICIIECYVDSDPFVTHEPFVLTEEFVDEYIVNYFDIIKRERIPKPKGFSSDWIELLMKPKLVSLNHRPYDSTIFENIANSYIELFSKGCEMINKGDYSKGISYLEESLEKNEKYFWTAIYLVQMYMKVNNKREAVELIKKIEHNINNDFYPYVSRPKEKLQKSLKFDTSSKIRRKLKSIFKKEEIQ